MSIRRIYRKRYFKCFLCVIMAFVFWTIIGYLVSYDDEDFPDNVAYDIFIDETKEDHEHIPLDQEMMEELQRLKDKKKYEEMNVDNITDPIILWWTYFTGEPGASRTCGDHRCFFTNNRSFRNHKNLKVFMFYGTDFSKTDLPLPRGEHHEWALFHEESPKNNYILCHEDALSLFNHTSTFRRESDFPITTQHLLSLEWLEQNTYMKTASQKNRYQEKDGLAPIMYVQSDCNPPSDRDELVKQLMKFVSVDSYGTCLKNKDLPQNIKQPLEGMAHKDFYELISQYKFALAIENAVCDDYITEKLWRPLMVGTVPIVFGSPKVKDFLPSNRSALVIADFQTASDLAAHIQYLNRKDFMYDKLRLWKNEGITNQYLRDVMSSRSWSPIYDSKWTPEYLNFIEAFECFICKRVHENLGRSKQGKRPLLRWADISHYGCPKPLKFDEKGCYGKEAPWKDFWSTQWERQKHSAESLRECINRNISYCGDYKKMEDLKKDF